MTSNGTTKSPSTAGHDFASAVVFFIGISQGLLPLVVKLIFGGERRFSPAGLLPAPWWWLACLTITAAAVVLLMVIDVDKVKRQTKTPAP